MQLQGIKDKSWWCECSVTADRHDWATWGGALWHLLDDHMTSYIEQDFLIELAQIQAESIGWAPLYKGAYLNAGSVDAVIQVVGVAKA